MHYQIASQLSPPQWAGDAEPDNSAATAILLPVSSATGGTLHYNEADAEVDQEDWYEVDVPQGGILRVTARKRGAGNAWIYLRTAPSKSGKLLILHE